jgi:hypothetical protein
LSGTIAGTSAFGDPTATTSHALCIYDDGTLAAEYGIEPGGTCANGKPCWKPTGDKGFKYKNTPPGNVDGISLVLLKSGSGNAKIVIKGKGADTDIPTLAQSSDVRVQLVNDAGNCWGAVFDAPAVKNDGEKFKDKTG